VVKNAVAGASRSAVMWALAALALSGLTAPASAAAAPKLPSHDPFYRYTKPVAKKPPGAVLRQRQITIAESGNSTPITATQVLYRTTGQLGEPTVTVATVIRPAGGVTHKIVAYQTAYDALGSECDPSYTLRGGNPSYSTAKDEEQVILGYVSAGYTVVVPDYEGERLDWGAGQESGYGTLDAIRATERLLKVGSRTPVGMIGYSGGSIATEFASELAPHYASKLHIVGVAEGGVPVDFFHNLAYINGSPSWSGVIPAVLLSLARAYRISFQPYLSAYGAKVEKQVRHECINNFLGNYPGLTIQKLLKPRYHNYLKLHDLVAISDHLIMSRTGTPKEPLFIGVGNADGTGDGVMVAKDVEALAHTYCRRGVPLQFHVYSGDDHTEAAIPFESQAFSFLTGRLNGAPATNGCSSVGRGNSLAPVPVPPALRLSVSGVSHRRHGLVITLASSDGPLTGLMVTLSKAGHQVARRALARLPMAKHQLVLRHRGGVPRPGRYKLVVRQGGLTLLTRRIRIG
jgi:hypothetical protein